ncbi:hypothetical protein CCAX7_41730 [Capsulimonas corticalis]|uniref:Uncharacterized protein n=1 Tax=Capsulimonas corticalis TaxID=2219043 RepID=A0A402CXY4_9BACT|nr:SpoIIE family protein phosphatase [Capsulimonas corticalis]BDI32122.1 hypothetical protein CCAX7_41730 [Capsulimonas corticalis]
MQIKLRKTGAAASGSETYTLRTLAARARAEEAIRLSQARTAEVLESIGDAFYAVDSEFRFTYVNGKAEQLWGVPRADLLGVRIQDAFPRFVGSPSFARILQSMKERAPCHFETLSATLGKWIEISVYPSGDGLSIYYRDISGRKAAEDIQREIELRFRQMADTVPNILWTARPDGSRDYYNQRWYDYTGLTEAQTHEWAWLAVVHPEDAPRMAASYRAAVGRGVEYADEFRLRRSNGEYVWHMARGAPIKNEDGDVIRWVGACSDITAHKQAEQLQAVLFQREHTIALQLQDALQRPVPMDTPGIAVHTFYEAALLEEAGVGGDFYDVYALNEVCTALVLGDVSGKGLKAAAQVATVRNMLRAFLYSKPTVAEAVDDLNVALAENNLLDGFATLFVGAYDSRSRILKYVNCGQEPALLLRASTGTVERLPPTGPIVGCMNDGSYQELTMTLAPGDALVIFSDGLTEVGPSRRNMLGVEGVTALLSEANSSENTERGAEKSEALVRRMISGVNNAAMGGVMRDDVCLLVAVVT